MADAAPTSPSSNPSASYSTPPGFQPGHNVVRRTAIRPFTPATARPAPSGDPPDLTLWGDESGRASRRS